MSHSSDMDNLDADLQELSVPALKVPEMSSALRDAIASSKPVALRKPMRELALFLGLSIPLFAGVAIATGVRPDLGEVRPLWLGSIGLVWFSSFLAASYLGFVPAKGQVRPRSQNIYQSVSVAALLVISLGLFIAQGTTSGSVTYAATFSNVMAHAPGCSMMGITAGVLPGLIVLVLMRRFVPVGRLSIGLSLGAAGGSLSGLVMHLHCPISERFHVGLIHGGCLIVSAIFVAGASQILLRERS